MILSANVRPENLIFYKTTFLLEVLFSSGKIKVDDLYEQVALREEMGYLSFLKCLEWLFLIDRVKVETKGGERYCLLKS